MALVLAGAPTPAGASGGKNVVLVNNETDGAWRSAGRVAVAVAPSETVSAENLALATSSCTDCRTVAVAFQAVLVTGDPSVVAPNNAAVASNAGCLRCETFASAYQYVVSTGGPAHLSADGRLRLADLHQRVSAAAASDLTFAELDAELDALAAELQAIVDDDVVRNGGAPAGTTLKRLDVVVGS
jgi:putative peptide zinc metalloprotease protein